ncbi:MAG: TrkH family potassium uptake protein [Paenibacillaceae bacterium]
MMIPGTNKSIILSPHQWMILGFAFIIFIGALLLVLPMASSTGESIGFLDAFFTSTSAVCVTGLVVLDTGQDFTIFGQIVIMILIQIGGLGFMTFGVIIAIILGKKLGLKHRLLIQESTKSTTIQGLVRLSLHIFMIAFVFEIIASIILTIRWFGQMGLKNALYYAVFHSISAFNNAGFALWPDSLSRYVGDPTVNIVITLLFIIGGIGFTVILDVYNKRKWHTLSVHSKIVIVTSTVLSLAGFLFIFILELINPAIFGTLTWGEKLWAAFFQGLTPRTAGFNTIDIASMLEASQFFIIFLMFIGASSGSTGGGIKTNTFVVLILAVIGSIRGREEVHIFNRKIANEIILRALAVIMISLGVVLFVAFLLTITEDHLKHEFIEFLFEATSAFGTVGLSMGLTTDLTVAGKIIIMLTMFIGRLGPLTLAFALSQKKRTTKIGYAEEKVLIG